MKSLGYVIGACLILLLVVGLVAGVNAQQPTAPAPTESKEQAQPSATPRGDEQKPATTPPSGQIQPQPPSVQTETRTERTERVVEKAPARFLGVDPTVAMVIGAVLVVVIVIAVVAMSRRTTEVRHTYRA